MQLHQCITVPMLPVNLRVHLSPATYRLTPARCTVLLAHSHASYSLPQPLSDVCTHNPAHHWGSRSQLFSCTCTPSLPLHCTQTLTDQGVFCALPLLQTCSVESLFSLPTQRVIIYHLSIVRSSSFSVSSLTSSLKHTRTAPSSSYLLLLQVWHTHTTGTTVQNSATSCFWHRWQSPFCSALTPPFACVSAIRSPALAYYTRPHLLPHTQVTEPPGTWQTHKHARELSVTTRPSVLRRCIYIYMWRYRYTYPHPSLVLAVSCSSPHQSVYCTKPAFQLVPSSTFCYILLSQSITDLVQIAVLFHTLF